MVEDTLFTALPAGPGADERAPRFLALALPFWETEYLLYAEPELAAGETPLVLVETIGNARRVAAVDRRGARLGLCAGQALSDARALVPGLLAREIDRARLARSFCALADWLDWASPLVGILPDRAAYGDLVLDIGGVAHLFGSEQALLDTLIARLAEKGFSAAGAVAPSIGAGWALARFSPGRVLAGPIAPALADLPLSALRLAPDAVAGLGAMGLKRIGQLYDRLRKPLQARFGPLLLTRLDQALGALDERMTPRPPRPERAVEEVFAEPIGLMDDVLATTRALSVRLCRGLERDGLGARRIDLFLHRVDHKVMVLSVGAARPTRDAAHIARLLADRADRLAPDYDPGFGIDRIRLVAGAVGRDDPVQPGAFARADGAEAVERLCERLAARLGSGAVLRPVPADTHIPERAGGFAPALAGARLSPARPASAPPAAPRPLRLLPAPEPVSVIAAFPDAPPAAMVWRGLRHSFSRASGPERIAPEWWRAAPPDTPETPADPANATRDYYLAEDEEGRRFWLFREGLYGGAPPPRWFMHGLFS